MERKKVPPLPKEVWLQIVENIPRKGDLKNLCLVSKLLHEVASVYLSDTLNIHIVESDADSNLVVSAQKFLIGQKKRGWNFVRNLEFTGEFDGELSYQCKNDIISQGGLETRYLLQLLPPNTIQSFSWNIGTCCPPDLIDQMSMTQDQSLQTLSISHCNHCIFNCTGSDIPKLRKLRRENGQSYELTPFKFLRKLSVLNIQDLPAIESLCRGLNVFAGKLETLRLDLMARGLADELVKLHQASCRENNSHPLFPRLKELQLSRFPFGKNTDTLIQLFNIHSLQSLKLTECFGSLSLLEALTNPKTQMSLESFELTYEYDRSDVPDPDPVLNFLESFAGLKNLSLLISDTPESYSGLGKVLSHHQATLKNLVYHCRDALRFVDTEDSDELVGIKGDELGGDLEFLGLDGRLEHMKKLLGEMPKTSLKILHIRHSGEDYEAWESYHFDYSGMDAETQERRRLNNEERLNLYKCSRQMLGAWIPSSSRTWPLNYQPSYALQRSWFTSHRPEKLLTTNEFAEWAFQHIPSLEMIAIGDFQHHGQYRKYNNVLMRWGDDEAARKKIYDETRQDWGLPFKILTKEERIENGIWEVLDDNKMGHKMLEACPTTRIASDLWRWTSDRWHPTFYYPSSP